MYLSTLLAIVFVSGWCYGDVIQKRNNTDYCAVVRCAQVTKEDCDQQGKDFRPKGSNCGCCNACMDFLNDGAYCCLDPRPDECGFPRQEPRCKPGSQCSNCHCTPSCNCRENCKCDSSCGCAHPHS